MVPPQYAVRGLGHAAPGEEGGVARAGCDVQQDRNPEQHTSRDEGLSSSATRAGTGT